MSGEASKAASTGASPDSMAVQPNSTSFAEFLTSVPPGEMRRVERLREFHLLPGFTTHSALLSTPELFMHCTSQECNGDRVFRSLKPEVTAGAAVSDTFVQYICSNCSRFQKTFALRVTFFDINDLSGNCIKFGEIPPFGPPTPPRLLRLFGEDREIFLKGRRCENQGLGIGAFTYYRRIVENHKTQILDEIIGVATKVAPGMVETLERAKSENQFSKAVESVKDAIPPTLLINSHNPLTLLHSALSKGLHAQTDEQCLELARDIRLVLAELAERIGQALRDEAELNAAISRLMKG
jgi:hypothetical protein